MELQTKAGRRTGDGDAAASNVKAQAKMEGESDNDRGKKQLCRTSLWLSRSSEIRTRVSVRLGGGHGNGKAKGWERWREALEKGKRRAWANWEMGLRHELKMPPTRTTQTKEKRTGLAQSKAGQDKTAMRGMYDN